MTRSRATAKKAGASFEIDQAKWWRRRLNNRNINREDKNGNKDKGDLANIPLWHSWLTAELKNNGGKINGPEAMRQALIERINANGLAAITIIKRQGTTDPGEQWVLTTVNEFSTILTGERVTINWKEVKDEP